MSAVVRPRVSPVGATSLADLVYDLVRDQIITFKLKPFDALSEKKVAETVGVSRTPVREALARLATQRLVDIYPQRGTMVSPLRRIDLESSQFMREVLEVGLVKRVAALEKRDEVVKKLRAEVAFQEVLADLDDEVRFYGSDEAFHRVIAVHAGLPGMWEEIRRAKIHMDRYRHLMLATVERNVGEIADQHGAIIAAIDAGDVKAAGKAMRTHLRRVLKFVDEVTEIYPAYFEAPENDVSLVAVTG